MLAHIPLKKFAGLDTATWPSQQHVQRLGQRLGTQSLNANQNCIVSSIKKIKRTNRTLRGASNKRSVFSPAVSRAVSAALPTAPPFNINHHIKANSVHKLGAYSIAVFRDWFPASTRPNSVVASAGNVCSSIVVADGLQSVAPDKTAQQKIARSTSASTAQTAANSERAEADTSRSETPNRDRMQPTLAELADDAQIWATSHGLLVGAGADAHPCAVMHAPLSVLPMAFPAASFAKALAVAPAFNTLIAAVASDFEYLQRTLAPAAEFDDFTACLLKLHRDTQELREGGRIEQVALAINRSDYMLDEPSNTLMQVELNTIASSFGALSAVVTQLHRYTLGRSGRTDISQEQLPDNTAIEDIAEAMAAAIAEVAPGSVMLMVVQPGEQNSYDQQLIQIALWEQRGVHTLRRSFKELASDSCAVVSPEGALHVDGSRVGLVYLRAGYSPDDYPSDIEWAGRAKLERCAAVKCPSVAYQLAGAKKVQQDLARPGVVEGFMDNAANAAMLRDCFAGLWGLDDVNDSTTSAVLKAVTEDPDAYVLKPQREGGGNNLYGQQAAEVITKRQGLAAYILMQRIRPPIKSTAMVRGGEVVEVDALSELGVFGVYLERQGKVLLNKQAGHLLRTKAASSDEGGVAAGFAVLDSPYLTH